MRTIRELREQHRLTQLELAIKIDVSPGSVYGWESGRTEPKVSQLRKLARLFDVSMDDIAIEERSSKTAA